MLTCPRAREAAPLSLTLPRDIKLFFFHSRLRSQIQLLNHSVWCPLHYSTPRHYKILTCGFKEASVRRETSFFFFLQLTSVVSSFQFVKNCSFQNAIFWVQNIELDEITNKVRWYNVIFIFVYFCYSLRSTINPLCTFTLEQFWIPSKDAFNLRISQKVNSKFAKVALR